MKKFILLISFSFLLLEIKASPISSNTKIEFLQNNCDLKKVESACIDAHNTFALSYRPISTCMKDDSVKGKFKRAWKKFTNFFKK